MHKPKPLATVILTVGIALIVVMAVATFVESSEGTDYVHKNIYSTGWFAALWALLAASGLAAMLRWRVRRLSVWMLHLSFVVILAGALLTHLLGRTATIHLRMGEEQDVVEVSHNGEKYLHRLNFSVRLHDFQVVTDDEGTPTDFVSTFTVAGDSARVSMNRIYKHGHFRFYQMSYDNDLRGSTLLINRDPYGIPLTYCGYLLLFLSFGWVVCKPSRLKKQKLLWLSAFVLTGLWCLNYFVFDGSWRQMPVLRSPLLFVHVVIIIVAYALLLIEALLSASALLQKGKAERLMNVSHTLLSPALYALTLGIFIGAIWANISWGNYWSWDSKETWALITMLVYSVPLHQNRVPALRNPQRYHLYMLLALLVLLMTYFGVNHLLTGLHSYN